MDALPYKAVMNSGDVFDCRLIRAPLCFPLYIHSLSYYIFVFYSLFFFLSIS